ncbi:MAG: DUF554 domain-containing protein [Syntrophomonadaceae bacterium]|nr:DUF554 domain-containing protein [Syntrophomonadaceae bacterium]
MLGTVINAAAIVFASLLGLVLRKGIPEQMRIGLLNGLGLVLVVLGVQMGTKADNITVVVTSLILGIVVGEWLNLQQALDVFGARLEARFSPEGGCFGEAFVSSSLLFCVGAMAIMGSLENGLTGRIDILLVKALLDGIYAVICAASMGIGVMFSSLPVLLYQGTISLLAGAVKPYVTPEMLSNLTSLGGILILGIGLNTLKLADIRIANLLPGLLLVPVLMVVLGLLG